MADFIATCIIETNGSPGNVQRMINLGALINDLIVITESINMHDGIILLPAAYFDSGDRGADSLFPWLEKEITGLLLNIQRNIFVVFGIDGSKSDKFASDQLAIAIDKTGIKAIGRKFHPVAKEKGHIRVATGYRSGENGYPRIISLNDRAFYIAVCYDVFGIKKECLTNPGIHSILSCIHGFTVRGEGGSGVSMFTRHGLAGASKQWNCPIYSSTVYLKRKIPQNWPSAILWNQGDKSTKEWHYDDNPIKTLTSKPIDLHSEKVRADIYIVSNKETFA